MNFVDQVEMRSNEVNKQMILMKSMNLFLVPEVEEHIGVVHIEVEEHIEVDHIGVEVVHIEVENIAQKRQYFPLMWTFNSYLRRCILWLSLSLRWSSLSNGLSWSRCRTRKVV